MNVKETAKALDRACEAMRDDKEYQVLLSKCQIAWRTGQDFEYRLACKELEQREIELGISYTDRGFPIKLDTAS